MIDLVNGLGWEIQPEKLTHILGDIPGCAPPRRTRRYGVQGWWRMRIDDSAEARDHYGKLGYIPEKFFESLI
jgi:hypothetical protein